jgi:hypothetical protein
VNSLPAHSNGYCVPETPVSKDFWCATQNNNQIGFIKTKNTYLLPFFKEIRCENIQSLKKLDKSIYYEWNSKY